MPRAVMTIAGDSVGRIAWRELRRDDDTTIEAVWSLNPTLAAYGPLLPSGVRVTLPDIKPRANTARKVVTAWD